MTGKDIIDYITTHNMEKKNFILEGMEDYYSRFFEIISKKKAKQLWINNDERLVILDDDGSYYFVNDDYETWEELLECHKNCLFGLER